MPFDDPRRLQNQDPSTLTPLLRTFRSYSRAVHDLRYKLRKAQTGHGLLSVATRLVHAVHRRNDLVPLVHASGYRHCTVIQYWGGMGSPRDRDMHLVEESLNTIQGWDPAWSDQLSA
jgi:hypothetical protein